jgi:glycine cleavage system transcriptional repressor
MINLRGQFAVIMLVEVGEGGLGTLKAKLAGSGSGLKIDVTEGRGAAPVAGVPYKIKTYSMDQPGLVHKVSDALRGQGVNIEELLTRQENAAFAGTPLFIMELRVTVPGAVSVRKLRGELERVCEGLNMDLDLEPG